MQPVAIIDISKELSERSEAYPGDRRFTRAWPCKVSTGSAANVSEVSGSSHLGTHVDLPTHLYEDSAIPTLETFIGPAVVVERPLAAIPRGVRVLVKGSGALDANEASAIVEAGAVLVGVEGMSVDELDSADLPNHRILLGAGVAILENLDLSAVEPGAYELIALPLKIAGAEATWVRAALRTL